MILIIKKEENVQRLFCSKGRLKDEIEVFPASSYVILKYYSKSLQILEGEALHILTKAYAGVFYISNGKNVNRGSSFWPDMR